MACHLYKKAGKREANICKRTKRPIWGKTTHMEANFWKDFVLYKLVKNKDQRWDDNINIAELRKQNCELETVKNEIDLLKI